MLAPPHAKSTVIGPASSVVTNQGSEANLASASSKLTAQLSLLDISDIYILYVASFYVLASYVNLFCVYFLKRKTYTYASPMLHAPPAGYRARGRRWRAPRL